MTVLIDQNVELRKQVCWLKLECQKHIDLLEQAVLFVDFNANWMEQVQWREEAKPLINKWWAEKQKELDGIDRRKASEEVSGT